MGSKRKIYDDGAIEITENESENKKEKARMLRKAQKASAVVREISVADAASSLYGYLNPVFEFTDFSKKGKCVFCGAETNSYMRTLCAVCMQDNAEKIYNALKLQYSNDKITL